MMPLKDLTGKNIGRLHVVSRGENRNGAPTWVCRCECGVEKAIRSSDLNSGRTRSCGCLKKETQTKHGLWGSPEYRVWRDMVSRCTCVSNGWYPHYGGRGIKVCNRWADVEKFVEDMGRRPTAQHSIDRIDNNGDYEPGNCRWATSSEQNRNQRIKRTNTSGQKGVSWSSSHKKYQAQIGVGGQNCHLGYYDDMAEAISARKSGEATYWL